MTYGTIHVSNNLLRRAFQEKETATAMKLQRLLYFTASEYAKKTGADLFEEQFQAWEYGPVLRSVYDKFGVYGAGPIPVYGKDAAGVGECVNEEADPVLAAVLDDVWRKAKHVPTVVLSRLIVAPGSAWSSTATRGDLDTSLVAADSSYMAALGFADTKSSWLTRR